MVPVGDCPLKPRASAESRHAKAALRLRQRWQLMRTRAGRSPFGREVTTGQTPPSGSAAATGSRAARADHDEDGVSRYGAGRGMSTISSRRDPTGQFSFNGLRWLRCVCGPEQGGSRLLDQVCLRWHRSVIAPEELLVVFPGRLRPAARLLDVRPEQVGRSAESVAHRPGSPQPGCVLPAEEAAGLLRVACFQEPLRGGKALNCDVREHAVAVLVVDAILLETYELSRGAFAVSPERAIECPE